MVRSMIKRPGGTHYEEITWDEFFQAFDENNLALVVQAETKSGQKSNFNKLVSRDNVTSARGGRSRTGKDHGRTAK